MSLGVVGISSGIVSTQKRKPSNLVLDEQPRQYDFVDKFIKQKADEARKVPAEDRNAKDWLALSADFVKKVFNPVVMH